MYCTWHICAQNRCLVKDEDDSCGSSIDEDDQEEPEYTVAKLADLLLAGGEVMIPCIRNHQAVLSETIMVLGDGRKFCCW